MKLEINLKIFKFYKNFKIYQITQLFSESRKKFK